jgi:hypothetical protein
MQVRTAPGQFPGQIYLDPSGGADNTYQLTFRHYRATTYASPLRDVFDALSSFLSHLNLPSLSRPFLQVHVLCSMVPVG